MHAQRSLRVNHPAQSSSRSSSLFASTPGKIPNPVLDLLQNQRFFFFAGPATESERSAGLVAGAVGVDGGDDAHFSELTVQTTPWSGLILNFWRSLSSKRYR